MTEEEEEKEKCIGCEYWQERAKESGIQYQLALKDMHTWRERSDKWEKRFQEQCAQADKLFNDLLESRMQTQDALKLTSEERRDKKIQQLDNQLARSEQYVKNMREMVYEPLLAANHAYQAANNRMGKINEELKERLKKSNELLAQVKSHEAELMAILGKKWKEEAKIV